ncbi:MAG: triose-phosphate isomerase [Flavobacteriaceae bacterium]|nr:triose-phosphate isomerase [Flavobacteriaceae bacterium]MDC1459865.1 triose-phosphate isomerase [Flavobacteriaceae bacterium]MDC3220877.1 triose-phosphate isomerase [Flavobacteriaceae bacterium]MDG1031621.1 triose-phosphate isomerase [Flavobacteriaceae bacterium]MDG1344600.1 triose-phosphate isomerase [Flavobacteriaceae bacterium]|tara:strand:- start:76 stop:828 length:753 start_codon:yes stop_codon:yes gene_type:complete
MRKKIVAGNWKMNNSLNETINLINNLKQNVGRTDVKVMIAPSFPFLKTAVDQLKDVNIEVVAQNINDNKSGAFTGEVSIDMLKSIGVDSTLIGHSERRAYYYEDDELLLKKINIALEFNMNVIFCFGEELKDRKSNSHFQVVKSQLDNTVMKLDSKSWNKLVLAYEPVWAIGTGETASADQAQEIHEFVRNHISEKFNNDIANNVSILYGGSVKPSNAVEIFSKNDVDGGLIGGAALNASDFTEIIKANS